MKSVFSFSILPFIFQNAFAQNYILVPKETILNSLVNFDFRSIANEYGLHNFASFNSHDGALEFYVAEHEQVMKHRNMLSNFFDIEEDVEVTLNHFQQPVVNEMVSVPWHLDRITKRSLPLDNSYPYNNSGSCNQNDDVHIETYVVDTGIDVDHPEFEGRAAWGENFVDDMDTDCNNHGTHVAGLIGSRSYGVCKDAHLFAVKVLDCRGSGALSGVISGIEWVYKTHLRRSKEVKRTLKSIINMSLGGGFSNALNRAVEKCVRSNPHFYVVVAAGNENNDACNTSPAGVLSILTVMASDRNDNRAWFSNWGSCANIYSPGVDILSTIPGGNTAVYSGTSMASPVMAGVLIHYIDMYPEENIKTMMKLLEKMGTKDVIKSNRQKTPNVLVYLERQ